MRCGLTLVFLLALLSVLFLVHGAAVAEQTPSCTMSIRPGESVQAAINAVPAGALICLAEGEWREDLSITKSVRLRGSGMGRTTIKGKDDGWWPVVWIGHEGAPEVWVEGITIAEGNYGLWAQGPSKVYLADVAIERNKGYGIAIWDSSAVTITGSTITANGQDGIDVSGLANATISGSRVQDNKWSGIQGKSSAEITISYTTVTDNAGFGLMIGESSQLNCDHTTISGSLCGIVVSDEARASVTSSDIEGGEEGGIRLQKAAQAAISASTIAGSKSMYGVVAIDSAEASITRSLIADQWVYGVWASDSALMSIIDSSIDGNTYGIVLGGSAGATLVGNRITSSRQYGVALLESPCFKTHELFSGYITGHSNKIPSMLDFGGNLGGEFCSALWYELGFLTTSEGGALDGRR
jgi:parallel beta-helix repeat protein